MMVLKYWKQLLVLATMLVCLAVGFWGGAKTVKPVVQVQEKIVEVEKVKIVTDKTKTTVTKPDGTVTVIEKEKTVSDKESTSTTDKAVAKKEPKYRLGVFTTAESLVEFAKDKEKPDLGVLAAMRIVGPAWVETSYNFSDKTATVGLSLEF